MSAPPFARGACPFFCPCLALYLVPCCTCTTELCSSTVLKERADTNERTMNEIQFNSFGCPHDARFRRGYFAAERSRSVFVTFDRDLEVPVNPPPFTRGGCPFFCPCSSFYLVPYCTCTTELYSTVVQYCSTVQKERADSNKRTNHERNSI